MVDRVGVVVRFGNCQTTGDVGIADELDAAVAAEDHQRVQVACAHGDMADVMVTAGGVIAKFTLGRGPDAFGASLFRTIGCIQGAPLSAYVKVS